MRRVPEEAQKLDALQMQVAADLLRAPSGRDAFEYGKAVGIYAGLEMAKQAILGLQAERDAKDLGL